MLSSLSFCVGAIAFCCELLDGTVGGGGITLRFSKVFCVHDFSRFSYHCSLFASRIFNAVYL